MKLQKGISGSTLKIIAIVTMFIDHIGALVLERYNIVGTWMFALDRILRGIGRLAFPIFCFLLIEGFFHTSNKLKYGLRLFVFALISEIPFDLATRNTLVNLDYQNVFFTLLIGFVTICVLDKMKQAKIFEGSTERIVKFLLTAVIMMVGVAAAYILKTDYSYAGVLTIVVMYSLYPQKQLAMTGACILLTVYNALEIFAFVDVILVKLYNGERGLKLKYVFYVFYPVHLLFLYFTAVVLGAW